MHNCQFWTFFDILIFNLLLIPPQPFTGLFLGGLSLHLFEYFSKNGMLSENQSFLYEGVIIWAFIGLDLGGEVPRLNHGPICFTIQNT